MLPVSIMSKMAMPPGDAVARLAAERPDWLPVLRATVRVAARAEDYGDEFPGAHVVDELARSGGPRWLNNLRTLVAYGFIEPSGDAVRGGNRRYYRMLDREGVEQALAAWEERAPRRTLGFVGVAASGFTDTATRAGDIEFVPDSWR